MKREPLGRTWVYNQVFSALFAAMLGGEAVANAALPVFMKSLVSSAEEAAMPATYGSAGSAYALVAAFCFAAYWWFRPMAGYLSGRRPEWRDRAYARFNGVFRFVACAYAAGFLLDLARMWATASAPISPRAFFAREIGPGLLGAYYRVYFAILYLEPLLFTKVAARFHDEDTIFEAKQGLALSLRAKLFLMVLNLIVIPFALLAASLRLPRPENSVSNDLLMIVAILAYAIGYSEMLYRGVTEPLAALVRKMGAVSRGDYSQKSIVLADDEIGRLKAHFNDMVDGLAERERLKDTFGRYVSVEIAKRLMESGAVRLGGESIEATILFSDIRDFTPMSERMTPQELVTFLNSYFSFVAGPIAENRGVINKFIGDAVMAIFCPQFGSKDHAADAVAAALAMRARLADFNAGRAGLPPVRFGVGIHSGVLVAGNIGTESRLEYTVIGDTVNTASRLESLNKSLDSTILLSDETRGRLPAALLSRVSLERCDGVRVKGKESALTVFKVV